MPHEMLLATEGLIAANFFAFKRPEASMELQMLNQMLLTLEGLAAGVTSGAIGRNVSRPDAGCCCCCCCRCRCCRDNCSRCCDFSRLCLYLHLRCGRLRDLLRDGDPPGLLLLNLLLSNLGHLRLGRRCLDGDCGRWWSLLNSRTARHWTRKRSNPHS